MTIALVGEQRVGAPCLHGGCIPAKELLQTAEVLRTVRDAGEFGVQTSSPTLDLATSQSRKHAVINRLTSGLETLLKGRKVTVVPGTGTLAPDARTIHVSDGQGSGGQELRGRNVLIATGSLPRSLPLPGLAFDGTRVMSSDHVLEVPEVPRRVAVIGGGAIRREVAPFLLDPGAAGTVLAVHAHIL